MKEHDHDSYGHTPSDFGKAFAVSLFLNSAFVVIEVVYGGRCHVIWLRTALVRGSANMRNLVFDRALISLRAPMSRSERISGVHRQAFD